MSVKNVSVLLVGASGYGHMYLNNLLNNNHKSVVLVGVVDIEPKKSDKYDEIKKRNIPFYQSMEEFYKNNHADLAIIATPHHLHKEQSIEAMKNGSNVLCEKPMTSNPDDIQEMIDIRNQTGKFFSIGFNWSFTPSVQQLKADILSGIFGKARRFKSLALWPRNEDYFHRSPWAGKMYGPNEEMIFDSVANNATSHFLHHLLYLNGETLDRSTTIDTLTAELYKVNDIETFDTCATNIKTQSNIDILYIVSHAVKELRGPQFVLEFEKGVITYNPLDGENDVVALLNDGTKKTYQDPEILAHHFKLQVCIDAILQGHQHILCGIEAATPHVQSIHAMHQSVPTVPQFPSNISKYDTNDKLHWVEGLDKTLKKCYDNWSLPSQQNIEWSQLGETIRFNK